MRDRGASSLDALFPADAIGRNPRPSITGSSLSSSSADVSTTPGPSASTLPALGSWVEVRIVALLVTGRKNIDENGRLVKETLGFAPFSPFSTADGDDDGITSTRGGLPLLSPALTPSSSDGLSSSPLNGDSRRPRPGDRVWLRLRIATVSLHDVMGGALPLWQPPQQQQSDSSSSSSGSGSSTSETMTMGGEVTVSAQEWAAVEAVFGGLSPPLDSVARAITGASRVPMLMSGVPVTVTVASSASSSHAANTATDRSSDSDSNAAPSGALGTSCHSSADSLVSLLSTGTVGGDRKSVV